MAIQVEQRFRIVNTEGWEHTITIDESDWVEIKYRDDTRVGQNGSSLSFDQEELRELIKILQQLVK